MAIIENKGILAAWFFGSLSAFVIAILSIIWTPYDLILEERLRMRPGLLPFEWWYAPPDVNRINIYLFNITNEERYMNGEDAKLKMDEIGPLTFKEVTKYSDVVFNENGTMTYTATRDIIFDPTLNTIDLSATLVLPNMGLLIAGSYYWDANFFLRKIFNYLCDKTNAQPIVHKTIHQIIYNNTDDFLSMSHRLMPKVAYLDNFALMRLLNPERNNRITVLIGPENKHQDFFRIDKFNGSVHVPHNGASCKDSIQGAIDGILYPQKLSKTTVLPYFYDLTCRAMPLYYQDEVYRQDIKAYRFIVPEGVFNRTKPAENDCYKGEPPMLNGLTDMSMCWNSFPVVGSAPHFLYGDSKLLEYVDGMKPNASKHSSFAIIEPTMGIAFETRAAIQMNIYMRRMQGFNRIFDKFSDMVIPLFHTAKYNDPIPTYIVIAIQIVVALPIVGRILTVCLFTFGFYCLWKFSQQLRIRAIIARRFSATGKPHIFEMESFLDRKRKNKDIEYAAECVSLNSTRS